MTYDVDGELTTVMVGVELTVATTPLIREVVPERGDRISVIADIVSCWFALSEEARASYRRGESDTAGMVRFGGDYVDEVDRVPFTKADPFELSTVVAERLSRLHWSNYVAELRQRSTDRAAPSADWLSRFPT